MTALLALAILAGSRDLDPLVHSLIAKNLAAVHSLSGAELKRKLYPAMKKKLPGAVWLGSARTGGQPGAIITLRLESASSYAPQLEGILIWQEHGRYMSQVLESIRGNVEAEDGMILDESGYLDKNRLIWCGDASGLGNWQVPMVRIYTLGKNDTWRLASSANSNGIMSGYPGTHFARKNGKADPAHIVAVMREYPSHLSQPHVGPLLPYIADWKVKGTRIVITQPYEAKSALAALDHLAAVTQAGKRKAFNSFVSKPYQSRLWLILGRRINVTCQGNEQFDNAHDFYYEPNDTAVRTVISFAQINGQWRVAHVGAEKKSTSHRS